MSAAEIDGGDRQPTGADVCIGSASYARVNGFALKQ